MLALDKPLGVVAGLALYGDHAEPGRIHYAPTRPSLATAPDGSREFSLVKYRPSDAADEPVGLLGFTVDLSVSERQREDVLEWLEDQAIDEAKLTPVTWSSGKAYLVSALSEGDGFVEKLHGEAVPNLMGDARAVMAASFTADGAGLLESLLNEPGAAPIGIRYALEYRGIRPALDVRIRAEYRRIYEELAWGFELGVAYEGVGVRAGVESATRKLVENGAIEIEVLHFSTDAEFKARVDEALLWLQDKILEDFFRDSLQPPAHQNLLDRAIAAAVGLGASTLQEALADESMAGQLAQMLGVSPETLGAMNRLGQSGGGQGSSSTFAFKLQFQLKDIKEDQLKTVLIDWTEAHAEVRTAAPQGLLADFGESPQVVEASELGSFWDRLSVDVRPLGDFAALGVERLVVHMAFPDEQAPVDGPTALTFEPNATAPQTFARWTDGRRPRYRVRPEVHFNVDGTWPGPPVYAGQWSDHESAALALHPLSDVPHVEVKLLPGTVEFEQTPQVQVQMRVDGTVFDTLQFTQQTGERYFRRRFSEPKWAAVDDTPDAPMVAVPRQVEARCTWFPDQGQPVTGQWTTVTGGTFLIPAPWQSQRQLRLFPLLPDDTLEAIVNVSISENGSVRNAPVLRFAGGDRRAQTVTLPALTTPAPPLLVSVLVLRGDGSTFVSDPVQTTDPILIVRDRDGDARRVSTRLIAGDTLSEHGVLAVTVQLLAADRNDVLDEVTFTPSARDPGTLMVPASDAAPRYRVVRYGLDGRANTSDPLAITGDQILVPAALPPE